jgi:hypothetical protein
LEYFEMKKSLVALAALAVVGAASAQSTVTMYGVVDMGINTLKDSTPVGDLNKSGVQQGTLSNSRIGFKGTEDLGVSEALHAGIRSEPRRKQVILHKPPRFCYRAVISVL